MQFVIHVEVQLKCNGQKVDESKYRYVSVLLCLCPPMSLSSYVSVLLCLCPPMSLSSYASVPHCLCLPLYLSSQRLHISIPPCPMFLLFSYAFVSGISLQFPVHLDPI